MKAAAVGLLALATLGGGAKAAPPSPACAAAEVALATLSEHGGDPRLFSLAFLHRSQFAAVPAGLSGLASGVESTAALARFESADLTTAMTCPNVRERAATLGEVLADDVGQTKLSAMGLNGKIALFWRISMPVLDRAGREAVVAAYASSNQLAGGSELIHLARQSGGAWKVTGRRVLTLS